MITPENIVAHELCGLKVEVVKSTDLGRIGLKGEVVDETQHTLVIKNQKGEKRVPKSECIFVFDLPPEVKKTSVFETKVQVDGAAIHFKPVDRVKRGLKIKRKWR